MKALKLCAVVLVLACPLLADSISAFAVQQGKQIDLGDPNLIVRPSFDNSVYGLGSTIPTGFEGEITFTLSVLGKSYVENFDLNFNALAIIFYFNKPPEVTRLTPADLTVSFAGYPEHNYSFLIAAVPEPSAFVLFGTGLLLLGVTALGWRAAHSSPLSSE